MAGDRQHTIPRFLQAGFASRKNGEQIFTWVYRVAQAPFECNIEKVGVERQFYSDGSDTAADDAITSAEGAFSELLRSLREAPPQRVAPSEVVDVLAHFQIRTRHLREALSSSADYLLQALGIQFADRSFATEYARKLNIDPDDIHGFLPSILEILQKRRSEVPAILKHSHIRALKSNVSPPARTALLRNLKFATIAYPPGDLILGDSIVLFEVAASRRYKTLLDAKDELKAVYLPLSPQLLLMGRVSSDILLPPDLPDAIARCSFEHFIADRNAATHAQRQMIIRESVTNDDLNEIVKNALRE